MLFQDRLDAGRQLAQALHKFRDKKPLVLAIPRGAVPMGQVVADALRGELDVVLVRKIGAPFWPEFAAGAVDESGWIYRNPEAGDEPGLASHIERQSQRELQTIRQRRDRYTPGRKPPSAQGRTVIVVDDGLATGSTMIAALHALRQQQPAHLVCAVPVAPPDTLRKVSPYADEVVCLHTTPNFQAVGQFYRHFDQVEDEEVIAVLKSHRPASTDPAPTKPAALTQGTVQMALPDATLEGYLHPGDSHRLVVFAHGSGSSRHSPRNQKVAQTLHQVGIGTLLFDMLTEAEDQDYERRFDIDLLTQRLQDATAWLRLCAPGMSIGYFGASTGAAAALRAAAQPGANIDAVVSRGGRPDLAGTAALHRVACPSLLIVGSEDHEVLALNRQALKALGAHGELLVVPGATHLFEEKGTLEQAAQAAADWFSQHLKG